MEDRPSSESRVAVVTGASRGLGRAIAVEFGRAGHRVLVNYRTDAAEADHTVKAVESAGGTAFAFQADVRDDKNVSAMVSAAIDRWGRLDALICNAAVAEDGLLLRLPEEAWDKIIDTVLTGSFHCLRHAGTVMHSRGGGAVVLVGSMAGFQGHAGQAPYAAAKAGLVGLMRSAAREWGEAGVRVNMVLPGWHATALTGFRDEASSPPFEPVLGHGTSLEAAAAFVVSLAGLPDLSGQIFTLDSRIAPL